MDLKSDFSSPSLLFTILFIIWTPAFWNILGAFEYKTGTLVRLFNDRYKACYTISILIFINSSIRNIVVFLAIFHSSRIDFSPITCFGLGSILIAVGATLASSAFKALGVTGTYLGDHCGIFLPEKLTGYPFNLVNNPMYIGSSLQFFGLAIVFRSPLGILLASIILATYQLFAVYFEEPFTEMIYVKKAEMESKKNIKNK